MSQKAIAARLRISTTALRNWFGGTKPEDERLTAFCRITGVSKRWINDGVGSPLADDDDELGPGAKSLLAFLAIPSTKATPDEIDALRSAMRLLGEHVTVDDWRAQLAVIRRTRGVRGTDPDVDLDGYPKVQ